MLAAHVEWLKKVCISNDSLRVKTALLDTDNCIGKRCSTSRKSRRDKG